MAVVSRSEQKQAGRHESDGHVERQEHDLRHAFVIGFGVQKNIRDQNRGCSSGATSSSEKGLCAAKCRKGSITKAIVNLEAERHKTAWTVTRRADTLNVSKVVCVMRGTPRCALQLGIKIEPQKKQQARKNTISLESSMSEVVTEKSKRGMVKSHV